MAENKPSSGHAQTPGAADVDREGSMNTQSSQSSSLGEMVLDKRRGGAIPWALGQTGVISGIKAESLSEQPSDRWGKIGY